MMVYKLYTLTIIEKYIQSIFLYYYLLIIYILYLYFINYARLLLCG